MQQSAGENINSSSTTSLDDKSKLKISPHTSLELEPLTNTPVELPPNVLPPPQDDFEGDLRTRAIDKVSERNRIVLEILETEKAYVKNLRILNDLYFQPLRSNPGCIELVHVKTIFSNIEVIKLFNEKLLADIGGRLATWNAMQKIADIFIQMIPFLQVYTIYINNFDSAISTVSQQKKKNKQFATFLDTCKNNPEAMKHDIEALLIMPVQRIPRYVLLLQALVKHTDKSHDDFADLTVAVEFMSKFANNIIERSSLSKVTSIL